MKKRITDSDLKKQFDKPDLVAQFNSRKSEAITIVHEMLYKELCYFSNSIIGNTSEAQDIVTEMFLKILASNTTFNNARHIKYYLCKAIERECYRFNAKRTQQIENKAAMIRITEVLEDSIEAEMIKAEVVHEVYQALSRLKPEQQQILKLFYLKGKDIDELAPILNIEKQSVRNKIKRAVGALKKQLARKTLILLVLIHFSPN